MTDALWSRCDGAACVRLRGLPPDPEIQVRSGPAIADCRLPPMAGRLVSDGQDMCFVPRFPFIGGTAYAVVIGGVTAAVLVHPRTEHPATTEVIDIRPSAAQVPRNLLRFYIRFSAPMSEGYATRQVRLADDLGQELPGALLPAEHELWDGDRRRLTVLLDPARIKRGLAGHRQAGYPLRYGQPFRLVVDDGFLDAAGVRLRARAERRYQVGAHQRDRIDPGSWVLTVPARGSFDPLDVAFGRPLDHGLLARCLRVVDPDDRVVDGRPDIGPQERSWLLAPRAAWAPGTHRLVIDSVLEDLAGNSVSRVFDRDLTRGQDEPREAGPVILPFRPR